MLYGFAAKCCSEKCPGIVRWDWLGLEGIEFEDLSVEGIAGVNRLDRLAAVVAQNLWNLGPAWRSCLLSRSLMMGAGLSNRQ